MLTMLPSLRPEKAVTNTAGLVHPLENRGAVAFCANSLGDIRKWSKLC
jgi:hypothetical protein